MLRITKLYDSNDLNDLLYSNILVLIINSKFSYTCFLFLLTDDACVFLSNLHYFGKRGVCLYPTGHGLQVLFLSLQRFEHDVYYRLSLFVYNYTMSPSRLAALSTHPWALKGTRKLIFTRNKNHENFVCRYIKNISMARLGSLARFECTGGGCLFTESLGSGQRVYSGDTTDMYDCRCLLYVLCYFCIGR